MSGRRPGAALLMREECEPVCRGRKSRTAVAGRRSRRSRSSIRHVKSRTCWPHRMKQDGKGLENGDDCHRSEFAICGNLPDCPLHSHSPKQLAACSSNAARCGLLAPIMAGLRTDALSQVQSPAMSNTVNLTMLPRIPLPAFVNAATARTGEHDRLVWRHPNRDSQTMTAGLPAGGASASTPDRDLSRPTERPSSWAVIFL